MKTAPTSIRYAQLTCLNLWMITFLVVRSNALRVLGVVPRTREPLHSHIHSASTLAAAIRAYLRLADHSDRAFLV